MTDRASRMYERWETHSEGLCPKCGEGDTAMAQEVSHIWQRWDTRPHKLTIDSEEMLLIKTKCSECDWEGYAMHEVSPFAGYITEEEIEQHSAMVDARDEAVTPSTESWAGSTSHPTARTTSATTLSPSHPLHHSRRPTLNRCSLALVHCSSLRRTRRSETLRFAPVR